MSKAEIVAFGPSLVDISATLSPTAYDQIHELLGVSAGDWAPISDPATLSEVQGLIDNSKDSAQIEKVAGSSTLGMLGAMSPETRAQSKLVSVTATSQGMIDPLSILFRDAVHEIGASHDGRAVEGHNPVGFVIRGTHSAEKTLAMFPGVAQELADYDLEASRPGIVVVDAYELQGGQLSGYLDGVITAGRHKIALSLGNHTILQGELLDKIRGYIDKGYIHILAGNEEEYHVLYSEEDSDATDKQNFPDHPITATTDFALLTRGAEGLSAHWDGLHIDEPAHPIDPRTIVNTSGAGDTVMGAFCEGALRGKPGPETLKRAAYYAAKVLQISGSMIKAA